MADLNPRRLPPSHTALLRALLDGATLKVQRTLDGEKVHRLYPLEGDPALVDREIVEQLVQAGLLASNMKFPAATYLLTGEGVKAAPGDQGKGGAGQG
jgi:hypothetical protein